MNKYSIYWSSYKGTSTELSTIANSKEYHTGSPSFMDFLICLLRENTNTPDIHKEKMLTNMPQCKYFWLEKRKRAP